MFMPTTAPTIIIINLYNYKAFLQLKKKQNKTKTRKDILCFDDHIVQSVFKLHLIITNLMCILCSLICK